MISVSGQNESGSVFNLGYTGGEETSTVASDRFRVYPNPAYDVIRFKAASNQTALVSGYELYDYTGRKVTVKDNLNQDLNDLSVNLTGMGAGVYMLRVRFSNGDHAVKQVILLE